MAEKPRGLAEILKDMADNSTIHGLPRISSSRHVYIKVLWTILFLATSGYLCFQLYNLVMNYYSWPVKTSVSLKFNRLPFPAISVCNWNAIKKSHFSMTSQEVQKYLQQRTKKPNEPPNRPDLHTGVHTVLPDLMGMFGEHLGDGDHPGIDELVDHSFDDILDLFELAYEDYEFDDYLDYKVDIDEDLIDEESHKEAIGRENFGKPRDKWMERIDNFTTAYKQMSRQLREKIGHKIRDMLMGCTFKQQKCKYREFKLFQSGKFGNCYTLNTTGWFTRRPGPKRGLWLTMNLEVPEYITTFMTGYGARLVIHEPNSVVFPQSEGITISPGFETSIGLRMVNITRLGPPYGQCDSGEDFRKQFGKTYTTQFCRQICKLRWTIRKCGCLPVDFDIEMDDSIYKTIDNIGNLTHCDHSDLKYMQCEAIVDHDFVVGRTDCTCNTPCTEQVYETTISGRPWPSDLFLRQVLVKHLCSRNSTFMEDTCRQYAADSSKVDLTSLKDNFVRIIIYYDDLNYEQIVETPMYNWFRFTSDIGGTLGLFVGASILSTFELVQFILELLSLLWKRLSNRQVILSSQIETPA